LSRSLLLALLGLGLLLPVSSDAREMKRKPLLLDGLGEELAAKGEYTDDMYKGLKKADACLKADAHWEREQSRPGSNIPINQIYETLASAVVCWQGAEKKAQKLGDDFAPVTRWVTARTRYIESYRSFVWSLDAKMSGDRAQVCRRLGTAKEQTEAATAAAADLASTYTTPLAQALGAQLDSEAQGLRQIVGDEFLNQKCSP